MRHKATREARAQSSMKTPSTNRLFMKHAMLSTVVPPPAPLFLSMTARHTQRKNSLMANSSHAQTRINPSCANENHSVSQHPIASVAAYEVEEEGGENREIEHARHERLRARLELAQLLRAVAGPGEPRANNHQAVACGDRARRIRPLLRRMQATRADQQGATSGSARRTAPSAAENCCGET